LLRWIPNLIGWIAERRSSQPSSELSPNIPADEGGETKPFVEHLDDLRKMLFKMIGALVVGFNLCLVFANKILFFLEQPLRTMGFDPQKFLRSYEVTGAFVLAMTLSFYGGLLLTAPFLLYFLAQFILPALRPKERAMLIPVCIFGALLFLGGAAMCFFCVLPGVLKAFFKYNEWMQIEPFWSITSYVGFVTQFMLVMGITFEVPLVMLILNRLGIVSAATMRRGRKVCIAIAVIVSAIVAPPDPLSMILMSIPLIALFEATIWIGVWMENRRRKSPETS